MEKGLKTGEKRDWSRRRRGCAKDKESERPIALTFVRERAPVTQLPIPLFLSSFLPYSSLALPKSLAPPAKPRNSDFDARTRRSVATKRHRDWSDAKASYDHRRLSESCRTLWQILRDLLSIFCRGARESCVITRTWRDAKCAALMKISRIAPLMDLPG
ncbi:hypothetical protein KM043_008793 [Ampulex compressa]|nr:hypothetical protein KM043_008793 [Ampulex compressa]